jgi:phosphatidylserine decarboxylase
MGTPAGIFAFLREDINECIREMLNEYGLFLKSSASARVLNTTPEGWFGAQAQEVMVKVAAPNGPPGVKFGDIYECQPTLPTFGFNSWDEFFIRKFKSNVRPVYQPSIDPFRDPFIRNCCESGPYALAKNVKLRDEFWLKGQPYALEDMIGDIQNASPFDGGTVYQAFLSALSYHCWHAPVDGVVKKMYNIPGSYYAENYWEGFANVLGPDPAAPNNSQGYISQVATRAVMLLEAANPEIGLMAIVQVGMAEVSTCEWDPKIKEGDFIRKGQLIGQVCFSQVSFTGSLPVYIKGNQTVSAC